MSFFNSGLFWFIEGILACLVVIGFRLWTRDRKIPMTPWKWLLFGVCIGLWSFTIAFVFTSLGENEPHAALMGGILFGLVTTTGFVGLWRVLLYKGRGSAKPGQPE